MSSLKDRYRVSFLGSMSIVTALIIFLYSTTFQTEHTMTILSAVLLMIAGLGMAFMMVGVKFEPFQFKWFFESIIWTALSAIAIWLTNMYVPFTLTVEVISPRLFAVLMGVAEECFFRLFLATFIFKFTKSSLLAIVISSGVWTVYHIGRYGGDMMAFSVIFVAGLVLGFVMLYSKMADGVIFAHALLNYIATA